MKPVIFAEFYAAYPRKRNKPDAEKAWGKIPPMLHAEIMAAIEAQKANNWKGKAAQWIPYPGTWLRAEGWLDEIEAPPVKPGAVAPLPRPSEAEIEAQQKRKDAEEAEMREYIAGRQRRLEESV